MSLRARLRRRLKEAGVDRSQPATAPFSRAPQSLQIRIEELVLNGFQATHRYRIGDAVERELDRLFESASLRGVPAGAAEVDRLDAGSFSIQPDSRPEVIGAQMAQAIYRSLEWVEAGPIPPSVHHAEHGFLDFGFDLDSTAGKFLRRTDAAVSMVAGDLVCAIEREVGSTEFHPTPSSVMNVGTDSTEESSVRARVPQTYGSSVPVGTVLGRQSDDRIPPIERNFEVAPHVVRMDAFAVPECDRGQTYDPDLRKCRPFMCKDFDLNAARRFVIAKLGETSKYVPPLAAAIRRGRFATFFPRALEDELKAGAAAVISKLREGAIKIECSNKVAGAQATDGNQVLLPVFATQGSPPWSQELLNRVVLHECLHLICTNLPSQPGKDPYENAAKMGLDPGSAMHADLGPIMTPFPNHFPKW